MSRKRRVGVSCIRKVRVVALVHVFDAVIDWQWVYLLKIRHGVAGLITPVDGDYEELVRSQLRDKLGVHVDLSASIYILQDVVVDI